MMKHPKLNLFVLFLLMYGCGLQTDSASDLTGEWTWVQTSGGIYGIMMTPESEGYSRTLYITKTITYSIVRDDNHEVLRQGMYRFTTVRTGGSEEQAIRFDSSDIITLYRISNDTLFLDPYCNDCFHDIYIRKP